MTTKRHANDEQTQLWNGSSGDAWIASKDVLDRMFQPFETLLASKLVDGGAQHVLDVGCGTGSTTLALARRLNADGYCLGADVSAPMIAVAEARARHDNSRARFLCADVQTHPFEPHRFDVAVSRFGVMFFDDPVVAFENLRRAMKPAGALHCIAWRSASDNPFMTTAERAAAPLLPDLPARQPGAPGQFAFADRQRVTSILQQSGWHGIDIQPLDVDCTLPESELAAYLTRLGPVGRVLQTVDASKRDDIVATIQAAFAPYVHADEVRYRAACWMIDAHA
ncbi:class I SAM-dependent methyltransferase [Paraburkholderia sp. D15]|uniref:class I SAM-dependent methyltransferase n=1 Tax=Paraburkholderia sp. D15 TaxID=2880218 RepID=UPI0024798720|nr:class I SAM-dependent methyltransferase [Paraburkholderia sp. D15]WGS54360.1 class I SAM-dependent methyltransferase [Paraburkholderia sp. D15]